jgi:hypothetical protein
VIDERNVVVSSACRRFLEVSRRPRNQQEITIIGIHLSRLANRDRDFYADFSRSIDRVSCAVSGEFNIEEA